MPLAGRGLCGLRCPRLCRLGLYLAVFFFSSSSVVAGGFRYLGRRGPVGIFRLGLLLDLWSSDLRSAASTLIGLRHLIQPGRR